jgi:hypothetical protein
MRSILLVASLLTPVLIGCRHRAAAPGKTAAQTPAQLNTRQFTAPTHGFAVSVPADWGQTDDAQSVLALKSAKTSAQLSIAVPHLPPHIPGIIPLGGVQGGYVDDLKKHWTDVKLIDSADTQIAGANARRFTVAASGQRGRGPHRFDVIAITREDKLYILTAEADEKDADEAKRALDAAAESWKWTK